MWTYRTGVTAFLVPVLAAIIGCGSVAQQSQPNQAPSAQPAAAQGGTNAINQINEALSLFASPDTPVLIVISESGGQKDYDRPTTIKNYLNYLKDQKKNINKISDVKYDGSGKITELELKKN